MTLRESAATADSPSLRRCGGARQAGRKLARQPDAARPAADRANEPPKIWIARCSTAVIAKSGCCITSARTWCAGSISAWSISRATRAFGARHPLSELRGVPGQSHAGGRAGQAAQVGRGGLPVHFHARAGAERGAGRRAVARSLLSDEFVRNYYRYADQMFLCRQGQAQFADIADFGFEFEIFASGEYSRMLEREWEGAPADASADNWSDAND